MASIFSSPAIRIFNQENTGAAPIKPGTTNTVSRKPFSDLAVNDKSPVKDISTLKKVEPKTEKVPSPKNFEVDDFFYDTYSFKDFNDNFNDIKEPLSSKFIHNIVSRYCNYTPKTPPHNLDYFIELPKEFTFDVEDKDESYFEISVEDVELPQIDSD